MDVGGWLRSLGLGQYEAAFRDNEIDSEVLPKLTVEDLKDLGVAVVGHRRKIISAIEELAASSAPAEGVNAVPAQRHVRAGAPLDAAERRQLTVMFCDLAGSTALTAKLDPEDMRGIIGAYQKAVAAAIQREEGFVAKYMGDGVLAYFGYPRAHEDDAERAVRAGLAIVEAAPMLEHSIAGRLSVRVGIATGLVVVGDLLGSGESSERGVVGETPNLAARLQGLARPDSVVIAEATRRLIGDLFELADLGAQQMKGVTAPARAFAVFRARSIESRFEALHTGGLSALVGREEELEILLRRWAKARSGEGQVVLLGGEAGIGKSRLTAALMERLVDEPHIRLRYFCSPQHVDSAFHPIVAHIERAAGIVRDDGLREKLDKLDLLLQETSTSKQDSALLAEVLSLPNDGRYPAFEITPQLRRQRTLETLVAQLAALTRQNPALMILEDAHWADPSSLEAFGKIADRIHDLRALLIVTFRPDFVAPWVGQPHVAALTLNRLTRRDANALMDCLIAETALPPAIRERIIDRTDGVPLFVEEMTKAVVEAANESAPRHSDGAVAFPGGAVPPSLQASLVARLDRLGAAKEIGQTAAAIGREFSHALLAAVARKPETELASSLDRLMDAGLLFRHGEPPHSTYLFKHALVRDAAYDTLLRSRRQQLHEQIVTALEQDFPEITETQPEILARHCTEARFNEKAVRYWRAAGEKAVRRANNREAIEHFRQALTLNETTPLEVDRSSAELAILSQLGPALMSVYGWSAPEVGAAFERAEDLARRLESSADLAPPLAGLWLFHTARGQFTRADAITGELFNVARNLNDADVLLQAHHCAWPILWFRGALENAVIHVKAGLDLYDEARHARQRFVYLGHDPAICAMSIGAILHWLLGRPSQGIRLERDAIDLARRLQHAPSLAHGLWFVCQAQVARGDAAAAIETANELLRVSDENGLPQPRSAALVYLGWAKGQANDLDQGIRCLKEGLAAASRLGARSNLCLSLCLLAETLLSAGRHGEALEQVDLALATSSEIGDRWCLPRIYIVRARLLHDHAAEASLRTAIEVAESQNAKGSQLCAATSLASVWRDHGRREEARDLLAPIFNWFTDRSDSPDFRYAEALLNELS